MQFKLTQVEARQKIYEALESGAFKQARKRLKSDDGFCCLGVMCEVFRVIEGKGEWSTADIFVLTRGSLTAQSFLPTIVGDWCGIRPLLQHELARANDDERLSLVEISTRLRGKFGEQKKESKRSYPHPPRDP
jgi:hypothetical protein